MSGLLGKHLITPTSTTVAKASISVVSEHGRADRYQCAASACGATTIAARNGRQASELLDEYGHTKIIVPQIAYESWAVATRPLTANGLGLTPRETESTLDGLLSTFRLLRDERAVYERWLLLVTEIEVKGKQVHDARLVAAMLRHGISHLLTFNAADFVRFSEITVIEPHRVGELRAAK